MVGMGLAVSLLPVRVTDEFSTEIQMALTINTNMASIKTERALAMNRGDMETTMQRLASGKRINSSLDDASGLAVANRMRNQIEGLNMAIRNANDGISMAQTAEGSMEELQNILQRMRELAVQSSNGTYTAEDRSYIAAEFDELIKEMRRVSTQAAWDGDVRLISEDAKPMQVQVGLNAADYIQVPLKSLTIEDLNMADRVNVRNSSGAAIDVFNFKVDFDKNGDSDTLDSGDVSGNDDIANTQAGIPRKNVFDAAGNVIDVQFTGKDGATLVPLPNFELTLWDGSRDTAGNPDGVSSVTLSAVGATSVQDLISQLKGHPRYDPTVVDLQFQNGEMRIVWKIAGSPNPITTFKSTNVPNADGKTLSIARNSYTAPALAPADYTTSIEGGKTAADYVSTATPPYWKQEFDLSGLKFHKDTTPKNAGNSFELQIGGRVLTADNVTDVTDLVNKLKADSDYKFVVESAGFNANYDMFDVQDAGPLATPRTQKLTVKFGQYATDRAYLRQSANNVTITDPESAITALDYVDKAAKVVNESRARMGATMSRIEYTINNLMNLVENTEEAKSRVLDTDYAKESANLAKAQVLAQAGTAMLAQANQSQQYVLNLLRQG
jgi:flagellin